MTTTNFSYRAVLFTQHGCPACEAMKPIWAQVAGEISEEYPELRIGWGEMNVQDDDWEFLESLTPESGNGTPEIAIFDEECDLIGFNGDGIMPASQLKDFVIKSIKGGRGV
jgi:thiol-disulfide isomerase/thioredoxin